MELSTSQPILTRQFKISLMKVQTKGGNIVAPLFIQRNPAPITNIESIIVEIRAIATDIASPQR